MLLNPSFFHIRRPLNQVANEVAKLAAFSLLPVYWVSFPPPPPPV